MFRQLNTLTQRLGQSLALILAAAPSAAHALNDYPRPSEINGLHSCQDVMDMCHGFDHLPMEGVSRDSQQRMMNEGLMSPEVRHLDAIMNVRIAEARGQIIINSKSLPRRRIGELLGGRGKWLPPLSTGYQKCVQGGKVFEYETKGFEFSLDQFVAFSSRQVWLGLEDGVLKETLMLSDPLHLRRRHSERNCTVSDRKFLGLVPKGYSQRGSELDIWPEATRKPDPAFIAALKKRAAAPIDVRSDDLLTAKDKAAQLRAIHKMAIEQDPKRAGRYRLLELAAQAYQKGGHAQGEIVLREYFRLNNATGILTKAGEELVHAIRGNKNDAYADLLMRLAIQQNPKQVRKDAAAIVEGLMQGFAQLSVMTKEVRKSAGIVAKWSVNRNHEVETSFDRIDRSLLALRGHLLNHATPETVLAFIKNSNTLFHLLKASANALSYSFSSAQGRGEEFHRTIMAFIEESKRPQTKPAFRANYKLLEKYHLDDQAEFEMRRIFNRETLGHVALRVSIYASALKLSVVLGGSYLPVVPGVISALSTITMASGVVANVSDALFLGSAGLELIDGFNRDGIDFLKSPDLFFFSLILFNSIPEPARNALSVFKTMKTAFSVLPWTRQTLVTSRFAYKIFQNANAVELARQQSRMTGVQITPQEYVEETHQWLAAYVFWAGAQAVCSATSGKTCI